MPKKVNHASMVMNATVKQAQNSLRTSGRKAPGTRIGLVFDWREGSATSGKLCGRYGRSLRDGR